MDEKRNRILKREWVVNDIEEFQRIINEHREYKKLFENRSWIELANDVDVDLVDALRRKVKQLADEKYAANIKRNELVTAFDEFKKGIKDLSWFQRTFKFRRNYNKLLKKLTDDTKTTTSQILERLHLCETETGDNEF